MSNSSVNSDSGAITVDESNNDNDQATMNLFSLNGLPFTHEFDSAFDLFPQRAGFTSCETQTSQMTIFYEGQVLVFNGLSNDKAKKIMDLASSTEFNHKKRKLDRLTNLGPIPNQNRSSNLGSGLGLGAIPTTLPHSGSVSYIADLPLARKASLRRFFEKRKDRIASKSPANIDMSKTWLRLGSIPIFQA